MNKFMAGPAATVLMFFFILAGIFLIYAGIVNDGLILWGLWGVISLTLAAVIRVWKTFIRKPESGG